MGWAPWGSTGSGGQHPQQARDGAGGLARVKTGRGLENEQGLELLLLKDQPGTWERSENGSVPQWEEILCVCSLG